MSKEMGTYTGFFSYIHRFRLKSKCLNLLFRINGKLTARSTIIDGYLAASRAKNRMMTMLIEIGLEPKPSPLDSLV